MRAKVRGTFLFLLKVRINMPKPNKKFKNVRPSTISASQDFEVKEATPMDEYEFQSTVLDWCLKLEEEIQDLKTLIEKE